MPLWVVHHSADVFSAADKEAMAEAIVALYPMLPKFYVGVAFHELPSAALFVGGKPAQHFVRIAVDHIARQFADEASKAWWLERVKSALAPFTSDRHLGWELHIDETPASLWLIQGMRPPEPNSDLEKRWMAENRPSA